MDKKISLLYHQAVLSLMACIRRRIADLQDKDLLDSLGSAHADAKLRIIHDDLRELLDFMDAMEGW